MVNDAHIHLGYSSEIQRGFNKETFLEFKEKEKIGHCLVFPIGGNENLLQLSHSWLKDLAKSDKTIKPLYWLKNDPWEFKKLSTIFNDGFIGYKYHAAYEKTPISNPIFEQPLLNLNSRHGILLVHCGMYKEGDMLSDTSYLHALVVAAKWRNIKIILAHMGGSILPIVKQVCERIKGIDNIWLETSGITSPTTVDYVANYIGVRKVLFGSDAPWCSFGGQLYNVMDSNLPDSKKELIINTNLLDLLHV